MRKKVKIITSAVILVIIMGIYIGINCWKNRKVEFADENMAKVICSSIYGYGGDVTPENVTWEQLDSIESLDIGYSGYYSTIKDIEKCRNLKKLDINNMLEESSAAYQIANGKVEDLSEKDVEKLQKELQEILPKLTGLQELWLADLGGCKWTSVKFLHGCNKLEDLNIFFCTADDYSVLKECKSLRAIKLGNCNVSSADELIGVKKLEFLGLFNTPLDQNPTEVQKLREAYPDVDIDIKKPSKKK